MILLDEPLEPEFRVNLREEKERIVRGKPRTPRGKTPITAGGKAPGSWIDLSPVTAISLAEKMTEDAELANFIAVEQGRFRYDYVRLRCSFFPCDGEKFEQAWLEVNLAPSQAVVSDPPIAWSIAPGSEYEEVEVTNSAKIGAKFKLLTGEISQKSTGKVKLYSIRGYREGGPEPFWEMKSNDLADLNGSLAFHLVVRSPHDVETKGSVKLSTMIGTRKFWVFHSASPYADEPLQSFVLPAVSAPKSS
jgi:hypothetical protein